MIIDLNELKNAKVGKMFVVGEAAKSSDLLEEHEGVFLFAGLSTAINWIAENMPEAREGKVSALSKDDPEHGPDFFHFQGWDEAMECFTQHPDKLVKFDPTEMRPTDFLEQGQHLDYDVQGDFIDMGRFVEGEPESMGQLHDGLARTRRVKLVMAVAQAWFMTEKELNHRGERIIRLVDALENAHVRAEINAVDTNTSNHTEVLVKRFDEPLVIEDIAIVSHSDFFRRLMFRCAEYSRTWKMNYGKSDVMLRNVNVIKSQLNDEVSVFIDSNIRENAIDKLFDELEKVLEKELSGLQPELNLISLTSSGISVSRLDEV